MSNMESLPALRVDPIGFGKKWRENVETIEQERDRLEKEQQVTDAEATQPCVDEVVKQVGSLLTQDLTYSA